MSYLQRIANLVAAPFAANTPAASVQSGAGAYALGHFLSRRSAAPLRASSTKVFAADGSMESNSFGPEAGPDSAPQAQTPVDVGLATARQTVTEPREVTGDSEQRSKSSKRQENDTLEVVRLSSDVRIQSGESAQVNERHVSDTDAKDSSESGTGKAVHPNPPLLRPAQPSPSSVADSVATGALDAVRRDALSGSAAGALAPTSSRAPRTAVAPGIIGKDGVASAVTVSRDDTTLLGSEHVATSRASGVPAHLVHIVRSLGADATLALPNEQPTGPSVSIESVMSGSRSDNEAPTVTSVFNVSARSERAAREASAPLAIEVPAETWRPTERRDSAGATERSPDASSPEPAVHIGSIEIIVEAPAAPRVAAPAPAPMADFSSRHYLRGL
ncbi:MAG: hypothetical protein ACJ8KO_07630 [Sulfurifustaceae bacterium]